MAFQAGAGSVSAPSFTFTADPNTGLYSPGADQVAIATNSVARLYVGSTGNIGVNQTSPAGRIDLDGNYVSNITAVGALDINCSLGNYFTKTINSNSTFTVSNVPSGRVYSFVLELTQTSGAVTWFSGVEWAGGNTPSLTAGKTHLFMFVTDDGGARWRGVALVDFNN